MKTNKTSKNEKFAALRGLAKRIATILLAGAMIVPVALSASACRVTIKDNGDGSYTITPNPNDQGNNNNNQGNNQGSTNTPQGGQTTPKEPDYSKYSPLLQEVLNGSYYDDLWRRYESNKWHEFSTPYDPEYNLLEAIPYDYLASKDEDIIGIKNDDVWVNSDLYTIQNEEKDYIYDRIQITYEVKDGENYMHQYLLQYQITKQELKDLEMLYWDRYFQGPVMFQRLASKQTPKVIAEFAITEKGNKNIIASCNNKNKYIAEIINYNRIASANIMTMSPITLWNELAYNIKFWLFSAAGKAYNGWAVTSRELYEVDTQTVASTCRLTVDNNIYDLEDLFALNPVLISSTPITYFELGHAFKNFKDRL